MKPTDSIRLTTFLLFFFVVFLSGAVQTPAQERIRIGISSSSPGFLPTVVAEQKGFFTKYGLASEHIRISLSVAMNALSTGDLDYAITMAQGIAGAIRGVPVKLLMMTQDKLVFFLMTRPGIQQVTDLRNKNVGISYFGSTTHLVADVIATRHGMVPGKDIHLVPSGDDNGRFASLETGRVDAVIGGPPLNMWGAKKNYKVIAWAKDYTNLAAKCRDRDGQKDSAIARSSQESDQGNDRSSAIYSNQQKGIDRCACGVFEVRPRYRGQHV